MSSGGGNEGQWISRRTIVANSIGSASEHEAAGPNKPVSPNTSTTANSVQTNNSDGKGNSGTSDDHEQEETKDDGSNSSFNYGALRQARRRSFYSNLAAAKAEALQPASSTAVPTSAAPSPARAAAAAVAAPHLGADAGPHTARLGANATPNRGVRRRAASAPDPVAPRHERVQYSPKRKTEHNIPPDEQQQQQQSKPAVTRKASMRRLMSLYADGKRVAEKLARQRARTGEGCTFKPEITKKASADQGPKGRARMDSLYRNAERVRNRILRKRTEPQSECTFTPKLVTRKQDKAPPTKSPAAKRSLLFTKLYSNASRREAKLEARRHELPEECTFSPVVNHRRRDAARTNNDKVQGASSRLYRGKEYFEKKKQQMEDKQAQTELKGCSFTPKINRPSTRRRRSRQQLEGSDQGKKHVDGSGESLSKPAAIVSDDAALVEEPVYNRLHRLHDKATLKMQTKLQEKQEAELAECTFRPLIWQSNTRRNSQSVVTDGLFNRLYEDAFQREQRLEKLRYKVMMAETNGFIPNGKQPEE
jgi:hypothetical protein